MHICGRSNSTIICAKASVIWKLFATDYLSWKKASPQCAIDMSQCLNVILRLSLWPQNWKWKYFGLVLGGGVAELCWINWFYLYMWRQCLTWMKKACSKRKGPRCKKFCPQLFVCPLRKAAAMLFCARCPFVHVDKNMTHANCSEQCLMSCSPFYP